MDFNKFVVKEQGFSVIDTRNLRVGGDHHLEMQVQLSRWVRAGKLIQLKRGLYLFAAPYRRIKVWEFYIANVLKEPSYISLEKALEYHGLIPEAIFMYTSVTTKRSETFNTAIGSYEYNHIKSDLFWGYHSIRLEGQTAFMASAEKALLDFIYVKSLKVNVDYLDGLRLQNVENINMQKLIEYAERFRKPGILKSATSICQYIENYLKGVQTL